MMTLTGKVKSVNPGRVFHGALGWGYTIIVNGEAIANNTASGWIGKAYASEAKQAMREEVRWQREHHKTGQ